MSIADIAAAPVYISNSQYNMVRILPQTTAAKICQLMVRKRNLPPEEKYALFVDCSEFSQFKLRPEQLVLEFIDQLRLEGHRDARLLLKNAELEIDSEESEEEDIFSTLERANPRDVTEDCQMAGYLSKRGELNKSFKQRYFEIQNGQLVYRVKPDGRRRGTIPLKNAVVEKSKGETSQSSGFTIRVPDTARVFLLKAPTFELMEKWITALRKQSSIVSENRAIDIIGSWIEKIEAIASAADCERLESMVSVEAAMTAGDSRVLGEFRKYLELKRVPGGQECLRFCIDSTSAKAQSNPQEVVDTYYKAVAAGLWISRGAASVAVRLSSLSGELERALSEDNFSRGEDEAERVEKALEHGERGSSLFSGLLSRCLHTLAPHYEAFVLYSPMFARAVVSRPYSCDPGMLVDLTVNPDTLRTAEEKLASKPSGSIRRLPSKAKRDSTHPLAPGRTSRRPLMYDIDSLRSSADKPPRSPFLTDPSSHGLTKSPFSSKKLPPRHGLTSQKESEAKNRPPPVPQRSRRGNAVLPSSESNKVREGKFAKGVKARKKWTRGGIFEENGEEKEVGSSYFSPKATAVPSIAAAAHGRPDLDDMSVPDLGEFAEEGEVDELLNNLDLGVDDLEEEPDDPF
ncbi:hypothetical protein AAMO2058_001148700 [Amorphochlora amoebiformis]